MYHEENFPNSTLKHLTFEVGQEKKKSMQSAFSFLCSDVTQPQLSTRNPGCQAVLPVSAAFFNVLSAVVPQRLFLMLICGLSILDRGWGSISCEGEGGGSGRQ